MYHATGNEAYKKQARYFLEERGKNPAFFAEEAAKRDWKHFGMIPEDTKYNQSHATIYEQDEAVGHSVRAVYMYWRRPAGLSASGWMKEKKFRVSL